MHSVQAGKADEEDRGGEMTEREIIGLAYRVRQKQKEYFKSHDKVILSEAKRLEKSLDIEIEDYLHLKDQVKQGDLFD